MGFPRRESSKATRFRAMLPHLPTTHYSILWLWLGRVTATVLRRVLSEPLAPPVACLHNCQPLLASPEKTVFQSTRLSSFSTPAEAVQKRLSERREHHSQRLHRPIGPSGAHVTYERPRVRQSYRRQTSAKVAAPLTPPRSMACRTSSFPGAD